MLKNLFDTQKLAALLPPNMAAQQVKGWICGGLTLELLGCLIAFAAPYFNDYNRLFVYRNGQRVLRQDADALVEPFFHYAAPMVWITVGLVLLALVMTVVLYSSYYQGSRSIYLMRRLPDGRETLRRQMWCVPLRTAALLLAAGLLTIGAAWLMWRYMTPTQCLPTAENLQRAAAALGTINQLS